MKKLFVPVLMSILGFVAAYVLFVYTEFGLLHVEAKFMDKLAFADGSVYQGEVDEEQRPSGKGVLSWANGTKYTGQFKAGLFNGSGELVLPNVMRYKGQFKNGLKHGDGEIFYADDTVYRGSFKLDEPQGVGSWTVPKQYSYTGEVRWGGMAHGEGEMNFESGDVYKGSFKDGLMHDLGKYTSKNGDVYEGDFFEDKFSGKGTYKSDSFGALVGLFEDWAPKGVGVKTDKEGNVWKGKFEYWDLEGEGEYVGVDGSRYVGGFQYGLYDGKGTLVDSKGETYVGEFSMGQKNGKGQVWYPSIIDKVKTFKGVWAFGDNVSGGPKRYSTAEVVEHVIYSQKTILDETLKSLESSNLNLRNNVSQQSNKPELYVMGVAGWGEQEVFRREIDFLGTQFSDLYGTADRSLFLVNSRYDLKSKPLATVTSIERSIQAFSNVMNKERDILFFYATSHGSQEGGFVLGHKGLSLGDLSVKKLKSIFDDSGIKYKVVIISACYSGQFVEALKDENTLVMSASDVENTSFGCGDDELFTYFGKAFFSKSLPESKSFSEAFLKASGLIAEWETKEALTHSNPMIHMGKNIEQQLKLWRKQEVLASMD